MNFWRQRGHTELQYEYCVKWLLCAHSSVDCTRFGIGVGVPALGDPRRRRVKRVISFVVEGDSFEAIFCLLDIRA